MNLKKFKQTGMMEITQEDIDDPGTRTVINNLMAKQQRQWGNECLEIAQLYGISDLWAAAVWYLRQRRRWTQELEDRLLEMARAGEDCPNMFEWPPESEHWL